jgi:hypothetical protein
MHASRTGSLCVCLVLKNNKPDNLSLKYGFHNIPQRFPGNFMNYYRLLIKYASLIFLISGSLLQKIMVFFKTDVIYN